MNDVFEHFVKRHACHDAAEHRALEFELAQR